MTVADLTLQIDPVPVKPSMEGIKTKAQITRLGRAVQSQVDKSTPRNTRTIIEVKEINTRKFGE